MKKKVIIFRFGSAMPTQKEMVIMDEITGGTKEAVGCSTAFGVLSIVKTSMTPAEVTELFNRVAKETNDSLPTIVFEADGPVGFNFDPEFFDSYAEMNATYDELFGDSPNVCTLSLDELLDLVKAKGVVDLTQAELTRLQELSK
jgi:hypothetical protein